MSPELGEESAVVADASALAKTLSDVHGRPSLIVIRDFLTACEALVLNDKIVIVGGGSAGRLQQLLEPLESADVLEHRQAPSLRLPNKPASDSHHGQLQGWSESDSWYEAGRLLGAEVSVQAPPLDLLRYRLHYAKAGLIAQHNEVCDLSTQYSSLDEALRAIRRATRLKTAPPFVIPIPAIGAEILTKASSTEAMLPIALELREKYRRVRADLCELRAELADPQVPPAKKRAEMKRWKQSWATLDKWAKDHIILPTVDAGIIDLKSEDLHAPDWLNVRKLLERAAALGLNQRNVWRVRPLHSTAKTYLNTPDAAIQSSLKRLFSAGVLHELNAQQLELPLAMQDAFDG